MSDEGIKPALTAAEWTGEPAGEPNYERDDFDAHLYPTMCMMTVGLGGDGATRIGVGEEHFLPLAAIALSQAGHEGEPWFTWEDVDHLRGIANAVLDRPASEPFAFPHVAEHFRELADRIAALLPPRGAMSDGTP